MQVDDSVTHNPGVLQWNHVVDINVGSLGVGLSLEWASPRPRERTALIVNLDFLSISLQDNLSGVALVVLHVPVREQVALVARCIWPAADRQSSKLLLCSVSIRDAALWAYVSYWAH